jgi:hypothetical protein
VQPDPALKVLGALLVLSNTQMTCDGIDHYTFCDETLYRIDPPAPVMRFPYCSTRVDDRVMKSCK